jgi:hypothetical protein
MNAPPTFSAMTLEDAPSKPPRVPSGPKPPYDGIRPLLEAGEVIPFLGAGVHLDNRPQNATYDKLAKLDFLPSGSELAMCLADSVNFPSEDVHDRSDLAKVASYYVDSIHRGGLRARLRDVFAKRYTFHPTADVHQKLAQNPKPLLVVTTNYDDLMERALRVAGKPFDLVVHPTDRPDIENSVLVWRHGEVEPEAVEPSRLALAIGKRWVVYKMHGSVSSNDSAATIAAAPTDDANGGDEAAEPEKEDPRNDSFVVTEEDYVDFLSRMTRDGAVPAQFVRKFANSSFLFLGYGLRDWNFRVVLHKVRAHLPQRSWAIQYQPSDLERALWEMREVKIYDRSITEFVTEMWGSA